MVAARSAGWFCAPAAVNAALVGRDDHGTDSTFVEEGESGGNGCARGDGDDIGTLAPEEFTDLHDPSVTQFTL